MNQILSRADRLFRPTGRVFYGWWIVMGGSGIQMLSGVLWMQSYGAYAVLLQEDFGWSNAVVAGAFALTGWQRRCKIILVQVELMRDQR